ncbi:MAG: hypothetical protein GW893_10115 [Armatimonadetes bacterium]|nr:hypothetical protein [Armatimonadota bacterium]
MFRLRKGGDSSGAHLCHRRSPLCCGYVLPSRANHHWIALLKGVAIIAFPEWVHSISEPMFTGWVLDIFPGVAVCLGVLFGYFGFACGKGLP